MTASPLSPWSSSGSYSLAALTAFTRVLRHLAAVYADHPDYREEWRP